MIKKDVVQDTYKEFCDPTVRQTVTAATMVRGVGGVVKPLYTAKACYIFNTYIDGVLGEACPNESAQHVAQFHICAICSIKGHAAFNCGMLRAFMKLAPFNAMMLGQVQDDESLPSTRGNYTGRGGRGGRGRYRGRGGRGGKNKGNNDNNNSSNTKVKDEKKGN